MQTSTVTVAVLREPCSAGEKSFCVDDVQIRTTRDRGKGGQHRNTTDSCVIATHRPTGLSVKVDGRCQHRNRKDALLRLRIRVEEYWLCVANEDEALDRRGQVGSGMRADKVRTYSVKHGHAMDHRSHRRVPLKAVVRGALDLFDRSV